MQPTNAVSRKIMKRGHSHLYTGAIQEIEDAFVRICKEYRSLLLMDDIESTILAHFLVHKELTQADLRALTKLSKAEISAVLSVFRKRNIIQKDMLKGTHTHVYHSIMGGSEYLIERFQDLVKKIAGFGDLIVLIKARIGEKSENAQLKGYVLLRSLVEEFDQVFPKLRSAMQKAEILYKDLSSSHNSTGATLTFPKLPDTAQTPDTSNRKTLAQTGSNGFDFEGDLAKLENEIVSRFIELGDIQGRKESYSKLIALFLIRRRLTQRDLGRLSGISAGAISMLLPSLTNIGMIKKTRNPKTREYLYEVEGSLPQMYARAFIAYNQQLLKFDQQIHALFQQLQNTPNSTKEHGFEEIAKGLEGFLGLLDFFGELVKQFTEMFPEIVS